MGRRERAAPAARTAHWLASRALRFAAESEILRREAIRAGSGSNIPGWLEPGAAPRRRAWREAERYGRITAPDHRRRWIRKDQHPGPPGCSPHRSWCRSATSPADDVLTTRGCGDDTPGRAYCAPGPGRQFVYPDRCPGMGGYLSWHRVPLVAGVRRTDRP